MEYKNRKCSFKEHKDIDAVSFCHNCNIYFCNKCINYHQGLFDNHNICNLDKNPNNEIFVDLCKEKNHPLKLEFYWKNHNKLYCAYCIIKLDNDGFGQHKDCNICIIEDIKEEKKIKLKDNIKYLEELSLNLENSIKDLKYFMKKLKKRKKN